MKKDIHPEYHIDSEVTCACGEKLTVSSNKPSFNVEVCSACHPFFTGKTKTIDTAGRVDKFKKRQAAASKLSKK